MTGEQDVKLYMYDLSNGMAKKLGSWLSTEELDGVWHTSVVVFGQEYYFNGDLVHVSPGETMWGSPTKVVTLGHTPCTRKGLHQYTVDKLRAVFNRSSYDALNNNCNHFADRVCMYLCHRHIPDDILFQPEKLAKLPALRLLRPFLDQWLGGGSGAEVCMDGLESAPTEDEPPTSSPSRRKAPVRRKQGSIVRGISLEAGEAQRVIDLERSRRGPVASPRGDSRRPGGRDSNGIASVGREGSAGEPSRGGSQRNSAEELQQLFLLEVAQDSPSKQPCWLGGCNTARSSARRGSLPGRDSSTVIM